MILFRTVESSPSAAAPSVAVGVVSEAPAAAVDEEASPEATGAVTRDRLRVWLTRVSRRPVRPLEASWPRAVTSCWASRTTEPPYQYIVSSIASNITSYHQISLLSDTHLLDNVAKEAADAAGPRAERRDGGLEVLVDGSGWLVVGVVPALAILRERLPCDLIVCEIHGG